MRDLEFETIISILSHDQDVFGLLTEAVSLFSPNICPYCDHRLNLEVLPEELQEWLEKRLQVIAERRSEDV